MPTYPYYCAKCDNSFDVIKSLARYDDEETCELCGVSADRRIGRVNFNNAGDWKPTFNPAFGRVVRSKAHQREILAEYRDKGREFEEVGNEPVENIHRFYDTKREEAQQARWNESTEQILSEALK